MTGAASVASRVGALEEMLKARLADSPDEEMKKKITTVDMNGKQCALCGDPLPERVDRVYTKRTDCGNHSIFDDQARMLEPISSFNKPGTNAWCELNLQKMCADSLYNKDFLFQAKAVDYPRNMTYDQVYCKHNGWLKPEIRALQHDFDGMKAKAEEVCNSDRYKRTKWDTTMTLADMSVIYNTGMNRTYAAPTEEEAIFVGSFTCAMGSAGCDMAYCAYSFCEKEDGSFGMYDECEGWDPVKGMPVPESD